MCTPNSMQYKNHALLTNATLRLFLFTPILSTANLNSCRKSLPPCSFHLPTPPNLASATIKVLLLAHKTSVVTRIAAIIANALVLAGLAAFTLVDGAEVATFELAFRCNLEGMLAVLR